MDWTGKWKFDIKCTELYLEFVMAYAHIWMQAGVWFSVLMMDKN